MSDLVNLLQKNATNVSITIGLEDLRQVATEFANHILDGVRDHTPQDDNEGLMCIAEVCSKLGVTKPTLWRWDKMGYLTKVMVGNRIFYRKEDIKRIINQK